MERYRVTISRTSTSVSWCFAMTLGLALLFSSRLLALDDAVPGKSLDDVHLGVTRVVACNIFLARNKYGADWKHSAPHHYSNGLMEDDLTLDIDGNTAMNIEILSRKGVVVQVSRTSTQQLPQMDYTFGQLSKKHVLSEKTYSFDWPDGGSINGYYFDDVRHGICFASQSQDIFFLTEKPSIMIIHKVGSPVIPVTQGAKGNRNYGEGGRVYANEQDYNKQMRHQRNDY